MQIRYANTTYDDTYTLKTNSIELPIEIRWRTSTLKKYKFWRVYTGVTCSYILNSFAVGESNPEGLADSKVLKVEQFQYALTLAAVYGTCNFYANYSLSPFFKKDTKLSNG